MTPAATEQGRNAQLDGMVRRMYRDMSIELNNCQAASDWVNMTRAEVAREKENALRPGRAQSLRDRLRNLVVSIIHQNGQTVKE